MRRNSWFCITLALCASPASLVHAGDPFTVVRDQVYVQRGDENLLADLYLPAAPGPFPTVLLIHGGAWVSGSKLQLGAAAHQLAAHQYSVVAISYRLAPKHLFPAQIDDCEAALIWIAQQARRIKADPKRIAAWGYSAGGHLAALLGVEGPVKAAGKEAQIRAVVAGGAPCEFRDTPPNSRYLAFWLGGSPADRPEIYRRASPAAFVTPDDPPFFFYHGEADLLVPLRQPQTMCSLLKSAGVSAQLYLVPGAGHVGAFLDRRPIERGIAFLDECLKKK